MNKHILFVMRNLDNPELFTREQKEDNRKSSLTANAAAAADAAAANAADANAAYAAYAAADAADAANAYAAYAAADAADAANAEYWVNLFFKKSGEDKQTYIDEVERLKEDKTMKHNELSTNQLNNLDTHIMTGLNKL